MANNHILGGALGVAMVQERARLVAEDQARIADWLGCDEIERKYGIAGATVRAAASRGEFDAAMDATSQRFEPKGFMRWARKIRLIA